MLAVGIRYTPWGGDTPPKGDGGVSGRGGLGREPQAGCGAQPREEIFCENVSVDKLREAISHATPTATPASQRERKVARTTVQKYNGRA